MGLNEATLVPYGAAMREQFLCDPNFLNLNHGSFGTYPLAVRTALRQYQDQVEGRPDPFIRYTTPKELDKSREEVAKLLNVPRDECVFVKNATTGVATVLQNLPFKPNDVIVHFETVYGAVEKGIASLAESRTVQIRKVKYEMPIGHEELVEKFLNVVKTTRGEGLNVKVAVFDLITSMPAVRFPFEKLTQICREEGILSLIDGAHGVGQIHLDLGELQPDFLASNCHKWLFVPRGCCVLYVPKRNQHLLRTTLPTSWGYIPPPDGTGTIPSIMQSDDPNKTAFESLFEFVATSDDTPYFCVPAALEFREKVCGGEDRIYKYLESLAKEAADIVAAALETEVMEEPNLEPGANSQLRRCGMSTVRLPIATREELARSNDKTVLLKPGEGGSTVKWFQSTLTEKYGTFVPLVEHGGWLWVRLSAQVYLEKKDFEWLAGVLKELCAQFAAERP
ncbi:pyridoxal phosphate-dependent transferase [Aspergillus granulosus]|uniref:Pyridoxal phosphate-dependent transferase n=1 Tax=Aspergillus granulosus TaxID=176169 RepID=A0ABR4H952_9EURO